jgi:predicted phage terminase large subunit-like protein
MQRPSPAIGAVFQRPWLDGRYAELPRTMRIVSALDASFKTGTGADYSAIVTVGSDGRHFFVLDCWRRKVEFPELLAAVRAEAAEWNPEAILVEDAAAGQSAIQALKRESALAIVPVKPEGSKIARAESVSPLLEAGKLLLPAVSPSWIGQLVEELVSFPAGRHDDMVDALVYALARLRTHSGQGNASMDWEPGGLRESFPDEPLSHDSIF